MAKDYITYNEHLNKELKTIGFVRKNMNQFVRKQDDVIQYLFWGHHTNGEHFVRYYDISVQIAIPTIDVLEHEIGVTCGGFGCQIDYCNPEGSYDMYKWRIAKQTTLWVNRDYINYMDYVSKCKAYIDGL